MKEKTPTKKTDSASPVRQNGDGWLTSFITTIKRMDGWKNILSGINSSKDARSYSQVKWKKMTEEEIENTYAGDAMATKINDLVVEDAFADGYKWAGIKGANLKKFEEEWKRLCAEARMQEGALKGRLYGGACLIKVYNDDLRMENPVKPDEKKEIKNLLVFNRFELYTTYEDIMKDMLSPLFGSPHTYNFIGRGAMIAEATYTRIHASRTLRFDGAYLPDRLRFSNNYWHDTVLSKPYDALRNYANAHESVNAAIKDLSVAVFKMKDLADKMSANCDDEVTRRLEAVNLAKSIARAVVVDAEGEDFDYKTRNLTGASDLVDKAEDRLAAESNIPKTRLLGTSPEGGMGTSGNTEMETWYSFVESWQIKYLKPKMMELAKEICAYLGIEAKELDIEFNPLWSLSEKEVSEIRKNVALTDQIYLTEGVIDPSEVRDSRWKDGKWSMEMKLDKSISTEDLEQKKQELNANPDDDPNFSGKLRNPNDKKPQPKPKE